MCNSAKKSRVKYTFQVVAKYNLYVQAFKILPIYVVCTSYIEHAIKEMIWEHHHIKFIPHI